MAFVPEVNQRQVRCSHFSTATSVARCQVMPALKPRAQHCHAGESVKGEDEAEIRALSYSRPINSRSWRPASMCCTRSQRPLAASDVEGYASNISVYGMLGFAQRSGALR